jgi:hypothetical protein
MHREGKKVAAMPYFDKEMAAFIVRLADIPDNYKTKVYFIIQVVGLVQYENNNQKTPTERREEIPA